MENKRGLNALAVTIIILVIVGIGAGSYFFLKQPAGQNKECVFDKEVNLWCFYSSPENRACQSEKEWCTVEMAVEYKDISMCERAVQEYAKDSCYGRIAESLNDFNICAKASDKDMCYSTFAVFSHNSSVCAKITNPDKKETCLTLTA